MPATSDGKDERWCVYVPGIDKSDLTHRSGEGTYDKWYPAAECELVSDGAPASEYDAEASITHGTMSGYTDPRHTYGPTTVLRSAEGAEREEAWMREHSTSQSRKTHERRVARAIKAATTPSKIRRLTEKQIAHYEKLAEDATNDGYWHHMQTRAIEDARARQAVAA